MLVADSGNLRAQYDESQWVRLGGAFMVSGLENAMPNGSRGASDEQTMEVKEILDARGKPDLKRMIRMTLHDESRRCSSQTALWLW